MGRHARQTGAALALTFVLAQPGTAAAQITEQIEESGPVSLGDQPEQTITVEATYEEAADAPKEGWRRTLIRLRFRDQSGRLLSQETFETRFVKGNGFGEEAGVDLALELRGATRRFLLLRHGYVPSAPSGGNDFLVYGFDQQGYFRRLGPPIDGTGPVIWNPIDSEKRLVLLREGRYLDVGRWTGNFTLILPQEFKDEQQQFLTAALCGRVEVDPRPPPDGTVVLSRGPGPGYPTRPVSVSPASKVEFLDGCLGYGRTRRDEYTPWIHVRIDGEEGWLPNEEAAGIGLPEAG